MKTFIKHNNKEYPLVIVKWVDSSRLSDWHFIDTDKCIEEHECFSVGFLMNDSKYAVSIYPHLSSKNTDEFQGVGTMNIPKRCIVSLRHIETKKNYTE